MTDAKNYTHLGSNGVFTIGIMSRFWSKLSFTPLSRPMADMHTKQNHHLLSMTSIYDFWLVEPGSGAPVEDKA